MSVDSCTLDDGSPRPTLTRIPLSAAAPDLVAAGWERRFEADAARVAEATELYRSLGYEVTTADIGPALFGPECASCALEACTRYVTIYTRRAGAAAASPETAEPAQPAASAPARPRAGGR